ncbi:MAG: hypothetical protein GF416_08880 [Candidatus Altiarchaeales archaeon]|nr:hypothetical protein [Candidatus Altiarchaeales archaeon]MBD3417231.1 hypothetical protein [Candidatus Altiarchaeales archaeon]
MSKIKVVGVGGSGCATAEKMEACSGCHLVAVHTDAMSLLKYKVHDKILVGKAVTRGRSTGNNISLGEEAALSDRDRISEVLGDCDVVFLVAGLGGGTGAGASPIVAEEAKGHGSAVIAFVNIPFTAEGKVCRSNADNGISRLRPFCNLIVVVENDRFLKLVHDLSIRDAFTTVNRIILEAVTGMVVLIEDSGLENIMPMLRGYATLGHGVGSNPRKALRAALDSPLIGADISTASGVLLNFTSHSKSVEGIQPALEELNSNISSAAGVVWTNTADDSAEAVEVLALFSGVELTV